MPQLVGRNEELAALTRSLARPPTLVLVEGEAGIGKSRLLQEFLRSRASAGGTTLVAVCPPFRASLTLGPVVDAVRQARENIAGLPLSALAGTLRPLFPEWAADLPAVPEPLEDPTAARHRLFRALVELVDCLAVEVLVIEDLHWADEVTLEFLLFLDSRPASRDLCVIATYRPEDVPAGSLLLRLSSHSAAGFPRVRISLAPLDVAETAGMVSSMLDGEPVSEAFAAFLHERTDGLPLAIEESIRLLHDRAEVVREDGEWIRRRLEDLHVPPTVRDAVLERLDRLPPAGRLVVHSVAVLAEPADDSVVVEVAGLRASESAAGLSEAVASGLLTESERGGLVFRHALMGRAVYEAIPGPERRRLHLRAGRALERAVPPPVVELSRHFREADAREDWCRYAEQAADSAVVSGDHNAAAAGLNELLARGDHWLAPTVRARLATKLGAAALLRSQEVDDLHRGIVETLGAVLASNDLSSTQQAEIRNPLGRLLMQQGDYEAGAGELEQAIPHLGHSPRAVARAMIALAWPFGGGFPASVHRAWARRAAAVDVEALSPADRLALTSDRAAALLLLGDHDGWDVAGEVPTTASGARERREIARGYSNLAAAGLMWGCYEEAGRQLTVARELADAEGYVAIGYRVEAMQAELDWLTGTWDGLAERLAAWTSGSADGPPAYSGVLLVAGLLQAVGGDRSQAEELLRRGLDDAAVRGQGHTAVPVTAAVARLRLLEDRADDAIRVTDEAVRVVESKQTWLWATELAPVRVQALVAVGRLEEATSLVSAFSGGLRGCRAPAARASLATCRAMMVESSGDHARAGASFSRAATAWDALPRPYDALLAREREGGCLLAADDFDGGLQLLTHVHEGLTELGTRVDADRVSWRLRRHGLDVRSRWRGGQRGYGDELSPRELEVVRLVVAGRTRREIAATLFKSPRTVDAQVRSAMRKLGVSSRVALAIRAVEVGVVQDDGASANAGSLPTDS